MSGLSDSQWHWISVGVAFEWLAVYVDCVLVETVSWMYPYMGITTDGLLMVGGILEGFETPFEVFFICYMQGGEEKTHSYSQCQESVMSGQPAFPKVIN